ncbi:MAG TPA: hypothetical protein EYQ31_15245, partial [Candidatus Handelsmanbacteria bacterium]|nr:hypothetical protein [Candidatus Handelsmanbacteria bacterium]
PCCTRAALPTRKATPRARLRVNKPPESASRLCCPVKAGGACARMGRGADNSMNPSMKTVQTVTPVRRVIVPVLFIIFYGNPMILTDLRQLRVTV